MIDWDLHEDVELVDAGRQMPTRRPLSRPQSARMHRHADAMQRSAALRQITADQAASLRVAQDFRDVSCANAQESLRLQNELRSMHVDAFKERQRQIFETRKRRYYAADHQRMQEWAATIDEKRLDYTEAMADRAHERELQADMNKRTVRRDEREWLSQEQARSSQMRASALRHQAQLQEAHRERCGRLAEKRAEQLQAFAQAEQRRKDNQHLSELNKEIQRTEGRLLQLQRDKMGWRAACSNQDAPHPEKLIDEKFEDEATRYSRLTAQFRAAALRARPRPKSATVWPTLGSIAAFFFRHS